MASKLPGLLGSVGTCEQAAPNWPPDIAADVVGAAVIGADDMVLAALLAAESPEPEPEPLLLQADSEMARPATAVAIAIVRLCMTFPLERSS
jgi:hypothetical protein